MEQRGLCPPNEVKGRDLPLYPGELPQCCLPSRFLPLRSEPQRPQLAPDPGLPAAQHLEPPPPLLLSPLVQRYLEHVLLSSPPQLGYEEALLNPYSYHKVSWGVSAFSWAKK